MLRVAEDLWPHLESGERAQGAWDPRGVGAGGGWEAGGPGSRGLSSQATRAWVLALGLLSRVASVKVWAVGSLVCWSAHAGLWHPSKSMTVCRSLDRSAQCPPALGCHCEARPRGSGPPNSGPGVDETPVPFPSEADVDGHGQGRAR